MKPSVTVKQASTMGHNLSRQLANGTIPFHKGKIRSGVISPVFHHPDASNFEDPPEYKEQPDTAEVASVGTTASRQSSIDTTLSYTDITRSGAVSPVFRYAEPINVEDFPNFDHPLDTLDAEQIENTEDLPHCIVHCRHNTCKSQVCYHEKKPGHLPAPVCKCDDKRKQRSPGDRVYKDSTWFFKLRAPLINEIEGAAENADASEVITIYEDESLVILRAISDYQTHESGKLEELTQACNVLPRVQRRNVGVLAHNLINKGLVDYFWNTVAKHGEPSENKFRKVSLDTLIDELRIYQGIFMADMMREVRPRTWFKDKWIMPAEMKHELQRKRYKDMQPIWEYFDSTVDLLVMILLWRHKNVHEVSAKL